MESYSVYEDMSSRTGGDIYVGVVGPVRTGKSTFIKRFMETLVIPVAEPSRRAVMIDELPQASNGKTIMTTEPKFVPAKAEKIKLREGAEVSVRLVDCVGYAVEGANGFDEDGMPRLVNTPWAEEAIPFERAAEIGTEKVINEHSTIGVLVTTDGSVTELPRENYVYAEERAVAELKRIGKPFVVLLNCKDPSSSVGLRDELEKKYDVPVVGANVERMDEGEFLGLLSKILFEFPVLQVDVKIPKWLQSLPEENERIEKLKAALQKKAPKLVKMKDCFLLEELFEEGEGFIAPKEILMDLGKGRVEIFVETTEKFFYETLSEESGEYIDDDYRLLSFVRSLSEAKRNYDKIKDAFINAEKSGYGMVAPTETELLLAEPKLVKKSAGYGVKFKASAPAYHVVKIDVTGEVNPIVGTKQQGEEFVKDALESYEAGTEKVWQTNIFGKSLKELVMEELNLKTTAMPMEIRKKLRRTMMRVVNEGKGGIICILL